MSALSIRDLVVRFGNQEVLRGIDLDIESGEFVVLVGPSGCGKSTLLNVIAGLEQASAGRIEIGGRDVSRLAPKDRDIAMVFQSYALYPAMTVRGNITFGMQCRGASRAEQDAAVARVAALLQIGHLLDRKPGALSGGQRQRVAMGRALVRDPILFLFDEPLSNLDAKLRVEMRKEIRRFHQALGTTIVYVTHDQVEAMTLASRVAVMRDGVVQQFADPQTIYDDPANLFVASFMGSPPMNAIPARLEVHGEHVAAVLTGGTPQRLVLPLEAQALQVWLGRDVLLGIRAECIALAGDAAGSIEAVVEMIEVTGADTMAVLQLGGAEVTARMGAADRPPIGVPTRFAIDARKACLFDPETQRRIA